MAEIWKLVPKQLLTMASSSDLDLSSRFKEITGGKVTQLLTLAST